MKVWPEINLKWIFEHFTCFKVNAFRLEGVKQWIYFSVYITLCKRNVELALTSFWPQHFRAILPLSIPGAQKLIIFLEYLQNHNRYCVQIFWPFISVSCTHVCEVWSKWVPHFWRISQFKIKSCLKIGKTCIFQSAFCLFLMN